VSKESVAEVLKAAEEWARHILNREKSVVDDPVEQRLLSAVLLHRGKLKPHAEVPPPPPGNVPRPPRPPSFPDLPAQSLPRSVSGFQYQVHDPAYESDYPTTPYTEEESKLIDRTRIEDEDEEAV